ncbi:hypothetical protein PLESTM_001001500 [Pleodorina starrii]|nr:hypothetical protein PLESTM_001001500 [Pleodorina starrii]
MDWVVPGWAAEVDWAAWGWEVTGCAVAAVVAAAWAAAGLAAEGALLVPDWEARAQRHLAEDIPMRRW